MHPRSFGLGARSGAQARANSVEFARVLRWQCDNAGTVAEKLRSGLQNRVSGCESRPCLQFKCVWRA